MLWISEAEFGTIFNILNDWKKLTSLIESFIHPELLIALVEKLIEQ